MTYTSRRPNPLTENERGAKQAKKPPESLFSSIVGLWHRNRDLLHNAGSLIASMGVSAGLGFVYWAVAARLFDQKSVGSGSATISAMTLIGTVGMFGLGTILIAELPRSKEPGGLISAALIVSGLGSLALGLIFAIIAPHVSRQLTGIGGSPEQVGLFAAGVALTALTLVVDQATIGVLRGGIQLMRNTVFAVLKLVLLPVAAFTLHDTLGFGISFSWVAGMALSLFPVLTRVRPTRAGLPKPAWHVLRAMGKTVLAHNWLNLAISVSSLIMPVIVTAIVSPAANATYYVASMLAYFLYLIPTSMSTVLFAIAAADPGKLAEKLRFSLRVSWIVGATGMAVLGFSSHLLLSVFGAGYASTATLPLILLILAYIPYVPRTHYVAVCRAQNKIPLAAAVQTLGAVMEVIGAVAGARIDGLVGLSAGLLIARVVGGLMTTPAVVRASFYRGRKPGPVSVAAGATAVDGFGPRVPASSVRRKPQTYKERQEAGLAILLSMANTVAPQPYKPVREQQEAGLAALFSLAYTVASQSYAPVTVTAPFEVIPKTGRRPMSSSNRA